jgi:hypothetical protein
MSLYTALIKFCMEIFRLSKGVPKKLAEPGRFDVQRGFFGKAVRGRYAGPVFHRDMIIASA